MSEQRKEQHDEEPRHGGAEAEEHRLLRVRLPGFIDDEIGLGEAVQRFTQALGFESCSGCRRRAAALNRRVVFTPGAPKR